MQIYGQANEIERAILFYSIYADFKLKKPLVSMVLYRNISVHFIPNYFKPDGTKHSIIKSALCAIPPMG